MKGGFQNVVRNEVLSRMGESEGGKIWTRWVHEFMGERSFLVWCDGKDMGEGRTNLGVPQVSPLLLVIFLIWITPILEEMERRVRQEVGVEIELPSYMYDIHLGIYDTQKRGVRIHYGQVDGEGVRELLDRADKVIKEVVAEKGLPLEPEIEEKLVLRKGGRQNKKNREVERVKWLEMVFDEDLEFDIHWKGRIANARSMLGALNGISNS